MTLTFRWLGLLVLAFAFVSCRRTDVSSTPPASEPELPKGEKIELLFT
jgi:hypothetical protein